MSTDNSSSAHDGSNSTAIINAPVPSNVSSSSSPKKLSKMQVLQNRMKEDPIVFGFLGLTVAALTGGLVSLLRNDRKQSQMMMRARVFFQFCAVSSLVGGIYYRAYKGTLDQKSGKPSTDKRLYLTDPMPALVQQQPDTIMSTTGITVDNEKKPELR